MREPDNNADLPALMDLTARSDLMHDVTVRLLRSSKINFPGAIAIAMFSSERPWLRSGGRRLAGSAGLIQHPASIRAIVVSAQLSVTCA
jgi:hypothetical protein